MEVLFLVGGGLALIVLAIRLLGTLIVLAVTLYESGGLSALVQRDNSSSAIDSAKAASRNGMRVPGAPDSRA